MRAATDKGARRYPLIIETKGRANMLYAVKKEFINGALKGLVITDLTRVKFEVGRTYKACAGSDYRVLSCDPA